MELKGFKELLLKRTEDHPELKFLIGVIKDDILVEKVIESLEKMARPQASMGRGANAGVVAFAHQLKNKDVKMMRDALAHHISHYKSALKNGNREVADKHLSKVIPMMHLAGKAGAHSGGKLALDYIPLEPWETNYTTTARLPNGKLKEGTKGLGRRPAGSHPGSDHTSRTEDHRNVPDYRYLEMAPHAGHVDTQKGKFKGGYPFEEIRLGDSTRVDSGEGYLHHYEDIEPQNDFVPHPFDSHPVHDVVKMKQDHFTPEFTQKFIESMSQWDAHPEHQRWNQHIKDQYSKDPEGFKARGTKKYPHFYEGLNLLDQPGHARAKVEQPMDNAPAPTAAPVAAPQPNIEPTAAEPAFKDFANLPANLQAMLKQVKTDE